MSIKLGSTNIGSIYLGSTKIAEAYIGSVKVYGQAAPLVLPARTFRVKYKPGTQSTYGYWESTTLVDATNNIWDIVGPSWGVYGFSRDTNLLEIIGCNSAGFTQGYLMNTFEGCTSLTNAAQLDLSAIVNTSSMFRSCSSLTQVQLLNTSNLTTCENMFRDCSSLEQVPLFDTSSVTHCNNAFYNCYNVQSGALALYTQMSTQSSVPSGHSYCFNDCGRDTQSGAAELAQIPQSWGGTASSEGYEDDFY